MLCLTLNCEKTKRTENRLVMKGALGLVRAQRIVRKKEELEEVKRKEREDEDHYANPMTA